VEFAFIILSVLTEYILPQTDKYAVLREKMVNEQIIDRGVTDRATLNAMRKVPRHLFMPDAVKDEAYEDYPVLIGYGQTISQPWIVAYMTEVSRPTSKKRVLEIGTGSGYQAAILAEIVDTVYTIEIVEELAKTSSALFKKLGYNNIVTRFGDGYKGWPDRAPFDIIIVTAAPEEIPQPLIDQLAESGRLVIPVGEEGKVQELLLVTKKNGKVSQKRLSFVRFVPFKRL
jgi:protein-L-isoaspartate(D-aspartate) O-methyltransferase